VTWIEGFHGGFAQTVHIEIMSAKSEWSLSASQRVSIGDGRAYHNTTITNLKGQTTYHVRLFASNERGSGGASEVWNFTTTGKPLFS